MIEPTVTQYIPDYASVPGDTIAEILELRGMSQVDLARRLGLATKTVNEIVKGKAPITPETSIKLEHVLGVPASFWNAREQQYREILARKSDKAERVRQVSWLSELPVRELVRREAIPPSKDKAALVQSLLRFFGVASVDQWREVWKGVAVSFRKTKAYESRMGSLAAWLRLGELEAQRIECEAYNAKAFKQHLADIRRLTPAEPDAFEPELRRLCAESGVAFVLIPELPHTRACGATRWLNPDKAILQLSLRYRSNDQFWFSFFHEAGHILLHSSKEVFIEGSDCKSDKEEQADAFAANTLIPASEYRRLKNVGIFSRADVVAFAESIGIAPGIVVGRLQHDGLLPMSHLNDLKRRFISLLCAPSVPSMLE